MTNTAIDHYRSQLRQPITSDVSELEISGDDTEINSKLNYEDLIKIIQTLPPGYRAVFNLFAIDGFSHEEISEKLGISIGTSKSNLFKARQKLRIMLEEQNKITALNIASNGAIIINEQFKSQQDRHIFQAGT
jgi:RNA polymerase sigma-70 factor (ECF subfamily)